MKEPNECEKEGLCSEALSISRNCRHYAMCKVDFLETGVCASGSEKHYASFYPVGRMDLYAALSDGMVPVTEKCLEITDSCNLCGKCDYQCYFVSEMRPSKVMKALKRYVNDFVKSGGKIVHCRDDEILTGFKAIVGDFWATNDPAVRIAYHHDLCPHVTFHMPEYVILPGTKEEISSVIRLLNRYDIPYAVRGNGASSHGLVFSEGAVIDLNRMKTIEFHEKNWFVKAGPGVASYDLQYAARQKGYRVHTAEPAALVCANLMTSGILSTFSTTYGISADNYIDAEFVGRDGSFFRLNDIRSPNLFSFDPALSEHPPFAVCVSVSIKLHPVTHDEEGVLVPFASLGGALAFAEECAVRHIGLAIGILGSDFVSTFMAPSKKLAAAVKRVFEEKLDMPFVVLVIGDRYAMRAIREMGHPVIDQSLFKTLYMGLPSLESAEWLDLLEGLSDDKCYSYLLLSGFGELASIALAPSPAQLARTIDPELRKVFTDIYSRPEMSDLAWLNTFRIQSSRYCRENPCVALVCYLPVDVSLITEILRGLCSIADRHGIRNGFGFITPFDNGKRCVWEYDYYFDNNDPDGLERIRQAAEEAGCLLDEYSRKTGTVRQVRYVTNQGCCRKENLLYAWEGEELNGQ
ncbi:MAG TPA: FAD-binding protein [Clostridia bacterium]|nr:FAD-binding protein [Clostridia bacterium]